MMFEILTGIKMLSVGSFCSVVVHLNLFGIQLRPDHTEAHPSLWLANINFIVLQ